MKNPFDDLGDGPETTSNSETVSGSFTCQVCDARVSEASYVEAKSLLFWNCPERHYSECKGFHLD